MSLTSVAVSGRSCPCSAVRLTPTCRDKDQRRLPPEAGFARREA
jgi:hypothetical protein